MLRVSVKGGQAHDCTASTSNRRPITGAEYRSFCRIDHGLCCWPLCPEIAAMEARLNANLAAIARSGPTAPESAGALEHHQPTPGSIAAAERKLGEIPPEANQVITEAMAKAQEADQAGDKAACEQALEEVERTIRH
jgi:hypothetical protein